MPSFLSRLIGTFSAKRELPETPPLPRSVRRPRREPLDDEVADIIARLAPPADRRSSAAWDDYWRRQLSTGFAQMFDMMIDDCELVTLMRRRGLRRILVAGNGISIEPRALSAAGFDVVAVDMSTLPVQIAAQIQPSDEQLASIVGAKSELPGPVSFVPGDLFDETVAAGPFDVIIERRTAQGYPNEERNTLLESLAARLSPRGLFLSHCHDGAWRPGRDPSHVTGEWFRAHGWDIITSPEQSSSGRSAWLVSSTG